MTNEEAIKMIRDDMRLHHNSLSGYYRQALSKAIEALEQQTCEDCISRQAVKELYYTDGYIDFHKIHDLPSVTPKQKTGWWIKITPYPMQMHDYECSECYHETDDNTENYCSECGARMV